MSTDLHTAAARGDADAVNALLADGADVDAPGAKGLTPLMHAAVGGHAGVMPARTQPTP